MKKFNNFLEKAPLWKVFVFSFILWLIVFMSVFTLITDRSHLMTMFYIAITTSTIASMLFSSMISQAKKSDVFWKYAEEVEKLIENAETKESINSILNKEWLTLLNLPMGGAHYHEIHRLRAIISTKSKYVK